MPPVPPNNNQSSANQQDIQNSEKLLDISNQLIDSLNERKKLLKGLNAEEQLYYSTTKQQQKLSQDIAANAEKYLGYQIKSKDLSKQINATQDNINKANYQFGTIENSLITQRKEALEKALDIRKQISNQTNLVNKLDEKNQELQILKNRAERDGNINLAKRLQTQITENQRIANNKEKYIKTLESQFEKEKNIAKTAREIVANGKEAQKSQQQELKFLERNLDIRKQVEKSTGLLGGISKSLSKLPGIGQYIKADEAIEEMEKYAAKIAETGEKATSFSNRLKIGLKGLETLSKGLIENLKSPEAIFTFLITQGLKADSQITQLGKSLGVSKDVAREMRSEMATFARETGDAFINTDRLAKAQAELSQELGIAVKFSNEELATFSKLTELTGLTAQEAGKLAQLSAASGISTKAYTDNIREGAFSAMQATKTHFSQKEIMQDISKLSAGILIKFRGNPAAIAAAVVEAKKFGLTLEQIDKVGESLLNFEQSIENELKAELITGKQLNLERARYAALTGNQLELSREIADQVGSLADYEKMNVIQQKSLAEAFGMSRDEMSEMLLKQEAIRDYGQEAAQLNKDQLEDMKRQGLSAKEYLAKQEQQRTAQAKFQDAMVKLQGIIANLVDGPISKFLDILSNVVESVVNLTKHWFVFYPLVGLVALNYLPKMLGGFGGIAKSIGGIFSGAKAGFQGIMGGLSGLKKGISSAFSPEGGGGVKGFFKSIKEGVKGTQSQLAGGSFSKGKELVAKKQAAEAEKTSTTADKAKGGTAEGFKIRMQNIAEGIKAFADGKVIKGAITLPVAGVGLLLFAPGVLGIKLIEQVKGEKFQEAMYGIAYGIADFGKNVSLGAIGKLAVAGIALDLFALSVPGLLLLQLVNGTLIEKVLGGIGRGIASLGKAVSNPKIIVGLAVITLAIMGIGKALQWAAPAIEAFGNVLSKVFSGIATVVTAAANGIATIFGSLQNVDVVKLLAIGPALLGIGAGLAALGGGGLVGGIMSGIGKLFGGDGPIEMLSKLAALGEPLKTAADSMQSMANALTQVSTALAGIDTTKLQELDKFASNRAEEESGGILGGITKLITAPIKAVGEVIGGPKGKGENIAPGVDLTPMIAAINEVKASVDKLYTKNSTINMDGEKVGYITNTKSTQNSYKFA